MQVYNMFSLSPKCLTCRHMFKYVKSTNIIRSTYIYYIIYNSEIFHKYLS